MAEVVDGPRVLGLGVGLFLLILLWSFALAAVLVWTRLSAGATLGITALAGVITAVMLAIPRHPPVFSDETQNKDDDDGDKIYDTIFIWRLLLLLILFAFAVVGALYTLCGHFVQPLHGQPIKRTKIA